MMTDEELDRFAERLALIATVHALNSELRRRLAELEDLDRQEARQ